MINDKLNQIVAPADQLDDATKIALGTAALNLATLEWVSGKYSTFICEKLHVSPNDLELCATYIYVGAAETVANNKFSSKDGAINIAEQYVTPELVNKLAAHNKAIMRFSKEISETAKQVDLSSIVVPAFEISFMWLEQLTNNIIIDTMKNTCGLPRLEDVDTNLFIYAYIGLVDGIECVDDIFGAGTLNKMQLHNVQANTNSSMFFQDSLTQAKAWYEGLSKKKKKQFSFYSN